MASPLARLLGVYAKLSHEESAVLGRIGRGSVREVLPRRDIIHEGVEPGAVRLILEGWACRYKSLPDGRRQTLAFFIPGDLCDPNVYLLRKMDHSIGAITPLKYAEIGRAQMDALIERFPRISQAIHWHELVNASIQREWILNIGQRNAHEHLAHLMAELFHRLRAVGLTNGNRCPFPLTQNDLADATGLTSVHVNRVMLDMRQQGLFELDHRELTIPDLARLEKAAMFNPAYLHLDHEGENLGAYSPTNGREVPSYEK